MPLGVPLAAPVGAQAFLDTMGGSAAEASLGVQLTELRVGAALEFGCRTRGAPNGQPIAPQSLTPHTPHSTPYTHKFIPHCTPPCHPSPVRWRPPFLTLALCHSASALLMHPRRFPSVVAAGPKHVHRPLLPPRPPGTPTEGPASSPCGPLASCGTSSPTCMELEKLGVLRVIVV